MLWENKTWYLERGKSNVKNHKWYQTRITISDNTRKLKNKENPFYSYTNIFLYRKNKDGGENTQCCFYFQGSVTSTSIILFLKGIRKCTSSLCMFVYNNARKPLSRKHNTCIFSVILFQFHNAKWRAVYPFNRRDYFL